MEKKQDPVQDENGLQNDILNQVNDNLSEPADSELSDENADDVVDENNDTNNSSEENKEKSKSFFGKKNNKEAQLKKQIEELELQKKELNDKFLRLYSEFDNYKKRTNKEKLDIISTASEHVIVRLLPIIDDFERAMKANETSEDLKSIKEGFELIFNKFMKLLQRMEVEEIQAKGQPFDTDFHEAITHFPASSEEEKGKVVEVTEKGYKLKNKVIRYSKVVVAN